MESWEIQGFTVEYDDDTHTYLADGIIIPSVTQIMKVKFGNKYSGVAPSVLEKAANRGTRIHKSIEEWCTKGIDDGSKEVRNFKFLQKQYKFKVIKNEVPLLICDEGKPIVAGRTDMIIDTERGLHIADIKSTSVLDKEYLAYQLSLYRLGYEQGYDEKIVGGYGVHLREDTRKLVKVPIKDSWAWNIIEEYERSKDE